MKQNWHNQFGEEYAVPAEVLGYSGIVDQSWGNDAAPSFTLARYVRDGELPIVALWVEHPDKDRRELDWPRFVVTLNRENDPVDLYSGDDLALALAALERGQL